MAVEPCTVGGHQIHALDAYDGRGMEQLKNDAAPEAVELARTNLGEQLRADCRRAAGGGAAAEGATGAAGAAPPDLLSEGESLYLAALGAEASLPALGAEASLAAEVAECDLACEVRHPRPGRDD